MGEALKRRVSRWFLGALLMCPSAFGQQPEAVELPYGDGLVATVGGEHIFGGDVYREVEDRAAGLRNAHPDPGDFRQEFRNLYDSALLALIKTKVVEGAAKAAGLTVPDTELDAQERDEIRHFAGGDREKYKALLAQKGLTIAKAREEIRRQILMMKVVQSEITFGNLYVSPEEIRKYYTDHPQEFLRPERVRPRIIRVVAGSEAARDRARRMAESLRRQIDAGADFEEIRRWTDGGSEAPAPEAEWRLRHDLEAPLESAVFGAEKGAVVGPVEGASGFYLARIEDREAAFSETFEEAQERIRTQLYRERLAAERNAAVMRLLRRTYVEIIPAELSDYYRRAVAEAPQPK